MYTPRFNFFSDANGKNRERPNCPSETVRCLTIEFSAAEIFPVSRRSWGGTGNSHGLHEFMTKKELLWRFGERKVVALRNRADLKWGRITKIEIAHFCNHVIRCLVIFII